MAEIAFVAEPSPAGDVVDHAIKMAASNVTVHYGDKAALEDVSIDIRADQVTALIGPSGCGKSTFLRCLNRMNDTIASCRVRGTITLEGRDIYARVMDVVQLRARIGMVFQKPNPFPKSIYENVAYGPRLHGMARDRDTLEAIVESSLTRAGLWDEVRDRLNGIETAPWGDMRGGAGLSTHKLAAMLKPFGVSPRQSRTESGSGPNLRGYWYVDLIPIFERYPSAKELEHLQDPLSHSREVLQPLLPSLANDLDDPPSVTGNGARNSSEDAVSPITAAPVTVATVPEGEDGREFRKESE